MSTGEYTKNNDYDRYRHRHHHHISIQNDELTIKIRDYVHKVAGTITVSYTPRKWNTTF